MDAVNLFTHSTLSHTSNTEMSQNQFVDELELAPKLAVLKALAADEHVTRVAERVGLPQPTVSRWLAELGDQLGAPIIMRSGRRVRLTRAGRLLALNWLPPWRGWEDALLYLFDLGTHESGELDPARFLRREIAGAHWRSVADTAAHVAPYTARMIERAAAAEHPLYLENSEPVGPDGA